MLPWLQFRIRQEEAEVQLEVEQNFKEPPNQKVCIMPEVGHQSRSNPAKPLQLRSKVSLAAIAESANQQNSEPDADNETQSTCRIPQQAN